MSLNLLVVVLLLSNLFISTHGLTSYLRRTVGLAFTVVSFGQFNQIANAITDCKKDCVFNCVKQAPGSQDYCVMSCNDYCDQDDRHDGLSGSIDAKNGETGIFGGSIDGTVVRDRPPILINLIGSDTMKDLMLKGNVKK